MAYVTRPALVPADFGYSLEKVEEKPTVKAVKPKPAPKVKVIKKKKKNTKKLVVKIAKKGRVLPWKV